MKWERFNLQWETEYGFSFFFSLDEQRPSDYTNDKFGIFSVSITWELFFFFRIKFGLIYVKTNWRQVEVYKRSFQWLAHVSSIWIELF